MKLNEYMMIEEAANFLGVTMNTLRSWDNKGKLKSIKHPINGYRLYRKEDLEKFLNEVRNK